MQNLTDVENAIRLLRSTHLQASGYLIRKLLDNLPQILDNDQNIEFENQRSIMLDLEDFGQINIVQIEEIGVDWKYYETKLVNRLLSHKEDD